MGEEPPEAGGDPEELPDELMAAPGVSSSSRTRRSTRFESRASSAPSGAAAAAGPGSSFTPEDFRALGPAEPGWSSVSMMLNSSEGISNSCPLGARTAQ